MEDLNRQIRIVRIIFAFVITLVIVVGLGFSYLVAELNNAPRLYNYECKLSLSSKRHFICCFSDSYRT